MAVDSSSRCMAGDMGWSSDNCHHVGMVMYHMHDDGVGMMMMHIHEGVGMVMKHIHDGIVGVMMMYTPENGMELDRRMLLKGTSDVLGDDTYHAWRGTP